MFDLWVVVGVDYGYGVVVEYVFDVVVVDCVGKVGIVYG